MNEALATSQSSPVQSDPGQVRNIIELWLAQIAETSRRAYRQALDGFAAYLKMTEEEAALALLRSRGSAHAQVLAYRGSLLEEQRRAPATVNLRLSALRSLVTHARALGLVDWTLEVKGVRSQAYRDTRGPGATGFKLLVQACKARGEGRERQNRRDIAILWLLYSMALRRGEVARLDLAHVDVASDGVRLLVRSKGARGEAERIPLTVPVAAVHALEAWLEVRGKEPGPLFLGCRKTEEKPDRLSAHGIHRMIRKLGVAANLGRVSPHGLRHAAITKALELCNGNIRKAQDFSRHKDPRVLVRYDDNRADVGGQLAAQLAEDADSSQKDDPR